MILLTFSIKAHEEKDVDVRQEPKEGAKPAYLLDRQETNRAKVSCYLRKDFEQYSQAEEKREGRKMGCSYPEG